MLPVALEQSPLQYFCMPSAPSSKPLQHWYTLRVCSEMDSPFVVLAQPPELFPTRKSTARPGKFR